MQFIQRLMYSSDAVHSASDVFSTIIVILGINIASRQSDDDHQYGHDRLECVAAILLAVVLFASASDVFSTIIVILGINIASRQSDDDHQYGHDRLECVAAILLAVVLFATGIGIGIGGINKIITGTTGKDEIPGMIALLAAVASILVKESMFWYTRSAAKKINSGALMADAWHHRSDALSSIGALIGIGGARLGFPVLDPIASVIICVFIVKAAYDIFKDAVDKMVDKSCDEETEEKMRQLIKEQTGVLKVDVLRTRLFGAKMYVDIEIAADGDITLREGHEIAQVVHDKVEEY